MWSQRALSGYILCNHASHNLMLNVIGQELCPQASVVGPSSIVTWFLTSHGMQVGLREAHAAAAATHWQDGPSQKSIC